MTLERRETDEVSLIITHTFFLKTISGLQLRERELIQTQMSEVQRQCLEVKKAKMARIYGRVLERRDL